MAYTPCTLVCGPEDWEKTLLQLEVGWCRHYIAELQKKHDDLLLAYGNLLAEKLENLQIPDLEKYVGE